LQRRQQIATHQNEDSAAMYAQQGGGEAATGTASCFHALNEPVIWQVSTPTCFNARRTCSWGQRALYTCKVYVANSFVYTGVIERARAHTHTHTHTQIHTHTHTNTQTHTQKQTHTHIHTHTQIHTHTHTNTQTHTQTLAHIIHTHTHKHSFT
jgi:hypothetical protein